MAKYKETSEGLIEYLKLQIESLYGKVSNIDNLRFIVEYINIYNHNDDISVITMKRLFGLRNDRGNPSTKTLNVLARICKYQNWQELEDEYYANCAFSFKSIPFYCLENDIDINYLISQIKAQKPSTNLYDVVEKIILIRASFEDKDFFKRIFEIENFYNKGDFYSETYNMIQLLGILCVKNVWLQSIIVDSYSKLTNPQIKYFIEWFIQIDEPYYNSLLEKYYFENKQNSEESIFYHLLKATNAINKNDEVEFITFYKKLENENGIVDLIKVNHLLESRWLGIKWYYSKKHEKVDTLNSFNEIIEWLENTNNERKKITNALIISSFFYKSESYHEILDLLSFNEILIIDRVLWLHLNCFKVYYAYCLLKTNISSDIDTISRTMLKAEKIFKTIDANNFDWNFREELLRIYEELKESLF